MSSAAVLENSFVDAAEVCPHIYRVLLENDVVRVLEMRQRPQEKDVMHSSRRRVVYALNYARMRIYVPDRPVKVGEVRAGTITFQEAVPLHSIENIGPTTSKFLIVEVK